MLSAMPASMQVEANRQNIYGPRGRVGAGLAVAAAAVAVALALTQGRPPARNCSSISVSSSEEAMRWSISSVCSRNPRRLGPFIRRVFYICSMDCNAAVVQLGLQHLQSDLTARIHNHVPP